MRILYAALALQDPNGGVSKKLLAQCKALRQLGHYVERIEYRKGKGFFLSSGGFLCMPHKENTITLYLSFQKAIRLAAKENFDLCYIRHIFCTPIHLRTLAILKRHKTKTVEELPTYPYDEELKNSTSFAYRASAVVDKIFRHGYKRYLSYFVTVSKHTEIFGVPTIRIDNGIDLTDIPFTKRQFTPTKEIRLIGVASMNNWHGYDRIICGLEQMEKTLPCNIVFELVGDGPCIPILKMLAQEKNVSKQVVFSGQLVGEKLDEAFCRATIGVASLGMHRIGLAEGSVLKIREYMARGLPFLYSYNEELFSGKDFFCLQLSADDSAVDIKQVLEFYAQICQTEDASAKIREFAQSNYSWDRWMNKIIMSIE